MTRREGMQSGKTTIFVNNSPKDGFREGDGDLMDKLTTELNTVSLSVAAVRIVCETQPADIERPEGQLVVIDDMPESKDEALAHLHPSQQKFVQHIIADPAENKILYLGSRIDSFRKDNNKSLSISVGSGAFVSEDMLVILKKHQVKMVVCCLEIEFHSRSLLTSFRLYEMLRNHLQYADVIHCLTARDMKYLQTDLMQQLLAGDRLVHYAFPVKIVEDHLQDGVMRCPTKLVSIMGEMLNFFEKYFDKNKEKYLNYFANFDGKAIAKKLQSTPCVYASGISTVTELSEEESSEEKLMQRERNVLVFGLVRSHKGIEEGLALGRRIFAAIFEPNALAACDIPFAARFSECNRSEDRNKSFQTLYDDLITAGVTKQANIELALNVSEENLLWYIQRCRYALKLDVKGFAENASSMISTMIGMCLPTIAQRGLVTPGFVADYEPALCLLAGGLRLHNSEVVPASVFINDILSVMQESDEKYQERLQAIKVLRGKKQFSIENTTQILMRNAFSPLLAEQAASAQTAMPLRSFHYQMTPVRTPYAMFTNTIRAMVQSVNPQPRGSTFVQEAESKSASTTSRNNKAVHIRSKL
jgi:hypothetical protein